MFFSFFSRSLNESYVQINVNDLYGKNYNYPLVLFCPRAPNSKRKKVRRIWGVFRRFSVP